LFVERASTQATSDNNRRPRGDAAAAAAGAGGAGVPAVACVGRVNHANAPVTLATLVASLSRVVVAFIPLIDTGRTPHAHLHSRLSPRRSPLLPLVSPSLRASLICRRFTAPAAYTALLVSCGCDGRVSTEQH